jgi:hypothetical protein
MTRCDGLSHIESEEHSMTRCKTTTHLRSALLYDENCHQSHHD